MNTNLLLGIAAVGYGIFTAIMRATRPDGFGKLEAMQEQWGEGAGKTVHVIAYTVMPILVGCVLIVAGLASK